jgi:hypothetical protein
MAETNIDKLVAAGVLDPSNLSAKHRGILNRKMTDAEVRSLIKAKKIIHRLTGTSEPWTPDADGAAF